MGKENNPQHRLPYRAKIIFHKFMQNRNYFRQIKIGKNITSKSKEEEILKVSCRNSDDRGNHIQKGIMRMN